MPKAANDVAENLNRLVNEKIHGLENPIERAMELVGDKYSILILHILNEFERQRFVELEGRINGISPRTLSARLKHLERYGLINRHQFPTIPPRVEYTLTDKGMDMAGVLKAMSTWADKWYPYNG